MGLFVGAEAALPDCGVEAHLFKLKVLEALLFRVKLRRGDRRIDLHEDLVLFDEVPLTAEYGAHDAGIEGLEYLHVALGDHHAPCRDNHINLADAHPGREEHHGGDDDPEHNPPQWIGWSLLDLGHGRLELIGVVFSEDPLRPPHDRIDDLSKQQAPPAACRENGNILSLLSTPYGSPSR